METVILGVLLLAVAEMGVSGTWQPFYFRMGYEIFHRSVQLAEPAWLPAETVAEALSEERQEWYLSPLQFAPLSYHEIAFREAFFSLRPITYAPVMHGLIHYDVEEGLLSVSGLVNWYVIPAFLALIAMFVLPPPFPTKEEVLVVTAFALGIVAVLYVIQSRRYSRVLDAVVRRCLRDQTCDEDDGEGQGTG
jgi:hypothetical protein